jgi:predicted  nucleic acid-binding Zn-ribbon protein
MLKRIVENLESVEEAARAFYKKEADGKFHLQAEKDEDVAELRNAKDHEKNLRVATEAERNTLKEQVDALTAEKQALETKLTEEQSKQSTDVATLEKSWSDKLEAEKSAAQGKVDSLTAEVHRLLVTNEATKLAAEISTVPELFADVIAKRLKAEVGTDNQYFTRVLDENGAPSAKTIDDLKKEFLANEKYSSIMIASKGSGGGADETRSGGGADEKKTFYDYSDEELSKMRTEQPELYARLRDAQTKG